VTGQGARPAFKVTKAAVHTVGVMAENVEAYLRVMKTLGDDRK
jgi:hypothetical protein